MVGEVSLKPAFIDDKAILRNLMELCQHDYSEFNGEDVNAHGLFGYKYLDHYWAEPGRHPFLISTDGKLAGFALVRTLTATGEDAPYYSLAEFFILRKYRRQGIGRRAAATLFDRLPGTWRVGQESGNVVAQAFWRAVISAYTRGQFTEVHGDGGADVVQTFRV